MVIIRYAEVGNDAPPLSVTDTYRGKAPFNGNPLVSVYYAKNNPDLVPERQKSFEGGLEMNFFNNRLGFDFALYRSNTFDQLIPLNVSQATGYLQKWINAGQILNQGGELMVLQLSPMISNGILL